MMAWPVKPELLLGLIVVWLLSACSAITVKTNAVYSKYARTSLYQLDRWSFDGRLAITGQDDSWSASLSWNHSPDQEEMKLSGPMGQKAAVIQLTDDFVSIDRGNGQVETSAQPEEFVSQQLGIFVPVQSLRYWVLGLPEPTRAFAETADGFTQAGWLVTYNQMQTDLSPPMPRKMTVVNKQVKLKLIIDQWILKDAKTK